MRKLRRPDDSRLLNYLWYVSEPRRRYRWVDQKRGLYDKGHPLLPLGTVCIASVVQAKTGAEGRAAPRGGEDLFWR